MDKLQIIKNTRKIAADTLLTVLQEMLQKNELISEAELASKWLKELRKHPEIFPNGWYEPPPSGIGVLFSSKDYPDRISYDNLRLKRNWPQNNVFLDKDEGLAYLFASPLDKKSAVIGDFGITIYFGKNPEVISHLKICLNFDYEILKYAEVGMSFAELANFAEQLLKDKEMENNVLSFTDQAKFNFGHTIPSTDVKWNNEEKKQLNGSEIDWEGVKTTVSKRRIFLNKTEEFKIKPGVAFTIEPRAKKNNDSNLPTALSYHTIGIFKENGEKELLTYFDDMFKLVGMDYMLT